MITLKKLREERNLTQEELALELNVSTEKMLNLENAYDFDDIYANELFIICSYFNVSPNDLLIGLKHKRAERRALETNHQFFKRKIGRSAISDAEAVNFTKNHLDKLFKEKKVVSK